MSPVSIYTPGYKETKWSKVPCLSEGRGLNPGHPDPDFEVLATWQHTSPQMTRLPYNKILLLRWPYGRVSPQFSNDGTLT